MSSPHRLRHDLYRAPAKIADPGDAGTITIDKDGGVCSVVTAGTETRTLRQPTKAGIIGTVVLDTDGGTMTLTVTGGMNAAADTSATFADAGDYIRFLSIKVGATYRWQIISQGGTAESADQSSHIADPAAAAAVTFTSHAWDGATDPTAAEGNKIVADLAALKTAADANNAAIDSILVALETAGITASS